MASQSRSDVALLYRRAGFGLKPAELTAAAAGGYEEAVERLLAGLAGGGQGSPGPTFEAGPPPAGRDPAAAQARRRLVAADVVHLQQWWLDRMITSSNPLQEKLTLYWHGHFATAVSKVGDARLMYQQNELFRSAGAGDFESLVQGVAKDGAMMVWLDTSTDKAARPNENFAREMMELFTLGIGNYTQDDVTAAARSFSGWVYDRRSYQYRFRPGQHDYGTKTYLGQTGDWNGEDIVRIAVHRPESARFLAARMWSHFAYPLTPADPLVDALVAGYGSDLSVTGLLRTIFTHPAFRSEPTRVGLVKQPSEWLAGAARALGLDASLTPAPGSAGARRSSAGTSAARTRTLGQLSTALGQTLFDPPNVGGWGQNGYWLDTATAAIRLECALLLADRADLSVLAAESPADRPALVAYQLGLGGWGPTSAGALGRLVHQPVQLVALALTAPEYVLA